MFRFFKQVFIGFLRFSGLLPSTVDAPHCVKWIPLDDQQFKTEPALTLAVCHYQFVVKLNRCIRTCNNLNDLSNELCVPNKTEDLNLSAFEMITRIKKTKMLTKHISCEFKCKFEDRKCNSNKSGVMIDVIVIAKIQRKIIHVKKIIFGILLHVVVKMMNI